jgi:Zn-dependent membrane protease YugP
MQIHVIGSFVFIFSWFVCFCQWFYLKRYSTENNRRGLAAGEIARQLLDSHGYAHAVVDFVPPSRTPRDAEVKKMYLPKPVFESASLYAIARAGHETVLMIESPIAFLPLKKRWKLISCLSWGAWAFLAASFYGPLISLSFASSFLFTAAFLAAIFFVPGEWETAERASELLKKTACFEIDEQAKLKNILRGIRLESLALILKAPFKPITSMMRKSDGF